ncbi:MAG: MATE family efflux transporter, partial [Lachnospiraceae bacterium]|nr:MATE family efflux transporter [Lachnospiraceae bacterium]
VANASGIILGNEMGEGKLDTAKSSAKRLMVMTIVTALFGSVIIFALIPAVMHFAKLSDQAMHYLKYMMLINTYYVIGSAVNTTLIAGVFRAGGDSKFGMICDTIDMWGYALPLGFLSAFVFKLPVMWVYFLLCTDEFVKWPWVLKNYFSGKWIKNITRDDLYEQETVQ